MRGPPPSRGRQKEGDEDRIDKGKKIVTYSIIGILVALAAMVIVRQIATFFTT